MGKFGVIMEECVERGGKGRWSCWLKESPDHVLHVQDKQIEWQPRLGMKVYTRY